jgi:C-terminal processing protease CtpA/Prc
MKNLTICCLLMAFAVSASGQGSHETPTYISKEDMAYDLEALNSFVQSNHPDAFYTHSKEKVEAFAENLKASLPDSLPRLDFWRICYKMMTFYNDAHTRMQYTPFYSNYVKNGGLFFPLEARFVEGELIVYNNFQQEVDIPEGAVIKSINGIPTGAVKEEIKLFSRGESDQVDLLQINERLYFYLWMAYGWGKTFDLGLEMANGVGQKVQVSGISLASLQQQPGFEPRRQDIVYVDELNDSTAYLYIKNLFSAGKKYYKNAFDEAFERINAQPGIKYLIIDNRFNDGGDDTYAEYLCRYFADQPFRSVARSYWYVTPAFKDRFKRAFIPSGVRWMRPIYIFNKHTRAIWRAKDGELAEVKKKFTKPFKDSKQFEGAVILLNDVGTFSAGSMFAAMFKDFEMGTIIGRPTGNISSFFANNIMRGRLSRSSLPIEVSTSYNVRPNGDESLRSIQPDVYVKEGEDILEFALRWIQK